MTKAAAATERPIATASFPLSEDRKSPVVLTDVSRGLLTEDQARDACRGLGHPDTRTDTPSAKDPYVSNLADQAAASKKEAAENPRDLADGTLDPKTSGEAAARTLDEQIADNIEDGEKRRAERRDKIGGGEVITAQDKIDVGEGFEGERPKPVGND